MKTPVAALPFIENRSHVLGTTSFISLLLHGLLLGSLGLAFPILTAKIPEDTGISIDLAIMETPAPKSEPPAQELAEAPPPQSEPEPAPQEAPEPAPVKKPKPEPVKAPPKKTASVKKTAATPASSQKSAPVAEPRPVAKATTGETTQPVPAGGSSTPKPAYPELARKRNQEGTVNIRCQVDSTGAVKEVSLAKSSGFRLLDEAALKTVRQWKFKPGKKDGINVAGTIIVPVQFKLR